MEKNFVRDCVPIIGSISSGKSTFLNSLISVKEDLLEEGLQTTTKFICVIRHNKEIVEPEFHKISIQKEDNKKYYSKIGERIKGKNDIQKAIKSINLNIKNIFNEKDIDISNLFYLLEINISFAKETTFFENYDLIDIPGLDEANTDYPEKIIEYLKDNLRFCIYMFNSNYYKDKKIFDIIKNIKQKCKLDFRNSLIILNKIDQHLNQEQIMREFRRYLMENLGDIIYDDSNFIIGLDSIYFKYENRAKFDIINLFNYYYKQCEIKIKEKKIIEEEIFLELIEKSLFQIFVENKSKKCMKFKEFYKSNSEKINEDEWSILKEIINNLRRKASKKGIYLMIDFNDNNEEGENDEENVDMVEIFIKAIYNCFKEDLIIINHSIQKDEIIQYFNTPKRFNCEIAFYNKEIFAPKDKSLFEKRKLMKRMYNFFDGQFKNLIPNDKDINGFVIKAKKLINLFFIEEKLRIPFLGCYNAGKSSVINSFIGSDLLPIENDECTKAIVFIRYKKINDPCLYKAELIKENYGLNRYYLQRNNSFYPIHGLQKIKEFLQSKNDNKKNNKYINYIEDKDLFFVIETRIKLLDDLELPEEIKNIIEFIDIPGLNTNNTIFNGNEGQTLQKIISVSNLFVFINPIDKGIKDISNKLILQFLFKNIEVRILTNRSFIDSCIFLINKCDLESEDEIKTEDIKKEFGKILGEDAKSIKIQKYSSLKYKEFLNLKDFYENFDCHINKYKNEYTSGLFKYYRKYTKTFENYLFNEIKNKFTANFGVGEKEYFTNNNIDKHSKFYLSIKNSCDNITKKTDEIINMIDYANKNFQNLEEYKRSGCENFFPFFKENIKESYNYLNDIYFKLFAPFLNGEIRLFFNRDKNREISNEEIEKLKNKRESLNKSLEEILQKCNLKPLLERNDKEIKRIFEYYKINSDEKIKDRNIEDVINELNKKIEDKLINFKKSFEKENNSIIEKLKKIINELENQVRQSLSTEGLDIVTIEKLNHIVFDNINTGVAIVGLAGGFVVGASVCGLSTDIALSGMQGGFLGAAIGAIIAAVIIGGRALYNYLNKKNDFLKLIEISENQYNSIFEGIKFTVHSKIEETQNFIKNLIDNTTNFLNKQISLIQNDKWIKAKKELIFISDKFEELYGKKN